MTVDFEINIASIIALVSSMLCLYVAIVNRLTQLETREEERDKVRNAQIKEIKEDLTSLSHLAERVTVLERDTKTLFNYYNDVKSDLKELKQHD